MRVLFISNFYPPVGRGGFEQWCQEVASSLGGRGHEVRILTSTHGRAALNGQEDPCIQRELFLEMEFTSFRNAFLFFSNRKSRSLANLVTLQQSIWNFGPDIIFMWGMWNFSRSLAARAEGLMPGRAVYYMGDYWPTLPSQFQNYWNAPARHMLSSLPKHLLRPAARRILDREEVPALSLDHVLFPSAFMKQEFERKGINPQNARIVYGAIDTAPYLRNPVKRQSRELLYLLYVGRLTREKGVHTAVQALGDLIRQDRIQNIRLSIVGEGDSEYLEYLRQLIRQDNLAGCVNLIPAQPKENLPSIYAQADIFLFTSLWPEPFGRVIVEAMASGLAVLGTRVGGAAELLIENENALTFSPGDPVDLRRQLKRLIESPPLRERLGTSGREFAVTRFGIQRMATEIESYLETLV